MTRVIKAKVIVWVLITIFVLSAIMPIAESSSKNNGVNESLLEQYILECQTINAALNNYDEVVRPESVEICDIDGQKYWKIYMSNEMIQQCYDENELDINIYKGYYYRMVLPNVETTAQNLRNDENITSVEIINSLTMKVYLSKENYINKFGKLDSNENDFPGYYLYQEPVPAPYLPLASPYPKGLNEVIEKRTPWSRTFQKGEEFTTIITIRPTSYQKKTTNGLEWREIMPYEPLSQEIISAIRATTTADSSYYAMCLEVNNDGLSAYNYVFNPSESYYCYVGAADWADFPYLDRFCRACIQFDISSIPDSDVTDVVYNEYIDDYNPTDPWLYDYEEIWALVNDFYHRPQDEYVGSGSGWDTQNNNLYNDCWDGTTYYNSGGWNWDRADGWKAATLTSSGVDDFETRLLAGDSWYALGLVDDSENNGAPSYYELISVLPYYSYLTVTYTVNNPPDTPIQYTPPDNAIVTTLTPFYDWSSFSDPDPGDYQQAYHMRVWEDTGPNTNGVLLVLDNTYSGSASSRTPSAGEYQNGGLVYGNDYHWHIRVQDNHGMWSEWGGMPSPSGHMDFTVQQLPDLTWNDIWTTPSTPTGGQSATITHQLVNNGGSTSTTFLNTFYIDGGFEGSGPTNGLGAGVTQNWAYDRTLGPGYHVLEARTDVNGNVPESDESNNIYPETIWWRGPDLIVEDIWWEDVYGTQNGQITSGQPVDFYWRVRNNGDATASGTFRTEIHVSGYGYYGYLDITNLGAGSTTNIGPWEAILSSVTSYTLTASVDTADVISEANQNTGSGIGTGETNNNRIETLTVRSAAWTFIIYMSSGSGGGNPLDTFVDESLDAMDNIGSNADLSIITLVDKSGVGNTKSYFIRNGIRDEIPLSDINSGWGTEVNVGDYNSLISFGEYSIQRYRADKYAVILFDHGAGLDGILWDDETSTHMTVPEVGLALNAIKIANGNSNIHLIGLEACLMGMIEVAHELKGFGNVMVGSEKVGWACSHILEPGGVFRYETIFQDIQATPSMNENTLGTIIVDSYVDHWMSHGFPFDDVSVTMSAINLNNLGTLSQRVSNFGAELRDKLPDWKSEITLSRSETESYNGFPYYDLYHFTERIIVNVINTEVQNAAIDIQNYYPSVIIHNRAYTGVDDIPADHAHGLTIFFANYYSIYTPLEFTVDTLWDDFLDAYYDTNPPTSLSISINGGATYTTSNSVTLTLYAEDAESDVKDMRFRNDGGSWTAWEPYSTTKSGWILSPGEGTKTVYFQVRDYGGNEATAVFDTIIYDGTGPIISSTDPSNGQTGVSFLPGTYYIYFSEAMTTTGTPLTNLPGITWNWIGNDELRGSYSSLNPSTTYYVDLTGRGFHDPAGNPLSGIMYMDFTTAAAPWAIATNPTSGGTNNAWPTITYNYGSGPTSVQIYYTTNGGSSWNLWGTDSSVDGSWSPSSPLPSSGTYHWSCRAMGSSNEPVPSGAGSIEAGPYVLDIDNPDIDYTIPVNGAIGVALNQIVIVIYNEGMDTTPGNEPTLTQISGTDPGGWTFIGWFNGNTEARWAHNDWISQDLVTLMVSGGNDPAGNPVVTDPYIWSFVTVDVVPPEIISTIPPDAAVDILITQDIVITFSEQMNPTTFSWNIMPDPGSWTETWSAGDTVITLSHSLDFAYDTTYTVEVLFAEDLSGNILVAGPVPNPWTFTTFGPPMIISTIPIDGEIEVAVNQDVVITFSEQMNPATFSWNIMPDPGSWTETWSSGDTIVTLSHPMDFTQSTIYTVEVLSGEDMSGNPLVPGPVPNPWTFTTFGPPIIINTVPFDGDTNVTINQDIVITFSEQMNPTTFAYDVAPNPGGWTEVWSSGDTVVTLIHTDFDHNTAYTVVVLAADDMAGNPLVAGPVPNPWTFTTILQSYDIPLHLGWNLISFPLVPLNTSIENVLSSISGSWDVAQYYDNLEPDPAEKWKTYATFKPPNLNTFWDIDNTMGVWIHITDDSNPLTIYGIEPAVTVIPLYAGWNLVGYSTFNDTVTMALALWTTGADHVEVYNATAEYLLMEVGPSYVMTPGQGYWVHVPFDAVWIIDW